MDLPQLAKNAPWYKHIGMNPKLVNDRIVVELELDKNKHLQALGTAHGGVIATLLDSAIGLNINYKLFKMGKIAVTVQLNVQYIKPVNSGKIIGEGFILYIGDKIAIGQGQVLNEDEERIAYGSATYYILKK
ncbi:hypothetical protein B6U96_12575 [Archaeoglobales archaeon ex4484_92]|nr:MAG: hypothetical protein B6U96_12575 [Archaeoglobales archaeon ex4484_92]